MKIKRATVTTYLTADGYDVSVYENVEVPDRFDVMDDDERAAVLDCPTPVTNYFIIRKVFDSLDSEVDYEV